MFAVILVHDADLAAESLILNTIFVTIALSVLLHGVTASPLADRYARWYAAHPREAKPALRASRPPSTPCAGGAQTEAQRPSPEAP